MDSLVKGHILPPRKASKAGVDDDAEMGTTSRRRGGTLTICSVYPSQLCPLSHLPQSQAVSSRLSIHEL